MTLPLRLRLSAGRPAEHPIHRTGGTTVLKRLAGPARHYFNSRFSAVHQSVVQGHLDDHHLLSATLAGITDVAGRVDDIAGRDTATGSAVQEVLAATGRVDEDVHQALALLGRSIDDLGGRLDLILEQLGDRGGLIGSADLAERLDTIARRVGLLPFDAAAQGALSQLAEYEASVANFAHAHNGWSAQAGLWSNPPLSVAHAAGGVALANVNERIAEIPFVFRELADLPAGARILDVGCTESTVPLSLATLGYDVTAVDPRPYPLSHPRLTAFQGAIADYHGDEPFDAVILLSSIEHFGIGAYELPPEEDADIAAMARIWELTRPGSRLVLTAPYGDTSTTALERSYGPERLGELLQGWKVDEQSYLSRRSSTEWHRHAEPQSLEPGQVVLVSATRSEQRP